VPKSKKVKVLTHRPRYIEPVVVPEFGTGSSSAAKTIQTVSTAHGAEEPAVMPKVLIVKLVETKVDKAEEPNIEKNNEDARDFVPSNKDNSTEGTNGFCRNS
jgi:hypothetical protein